MFSLYPSTYPQHSSPYYYSDDYQARDYFHTLAQQQARERQEARYRAQLEEASRRRAYQERLARAEAMRRRMNYPYNSYVTDDEPDEFYDPYGSYFEPQLRSTPRQHPHPVHHDAFDDLLAQRMTEKGSESSRSRERQASKEEPVAPRSSSRSSVVASESQFEEKKTTRPYSRLSSPDPAVRDRAARKIQSFIRAQLPRLSAFGAIENVSRSFDELKSNFKFPSTLDFAESPTLPSTSLQENDATPVPSLLYTARNTSLLGHEHALVKLLSSLDAIDSHGDIRVRRARKDLVLRIEKELGALDEKKYDVWRELVAKREMTAPEAEGDKRIQEEGPQSSPAAGGEEEVMSTEIDTDVVSLSTEGGDDSTMPTELDTDATTLSVMKEDDHEGECADVSLNGEDMYPEENFKVEQRG